uniref:Uncharacterized protein n=1 Tax=Anguilla anguilla TaxID=7936 RepID=A0A0E9Q778_ANGAN
MQNLSHILASLVNQYINLISTFSQRLIFLLQVILHHFQFSLNPALKVLNINPSQTCNEKVVFRLAFQNMKIEQIENSPIILQENSALWCLARALNYFFHLNSIDITKLQEDM